MLEPNITSQTKQQAGDLAKLARTIREAHETIGRSYENMRIHAGVALNSAMTAGDALAAARAKVKHGDWARWLRREANLSERTAQRYLQLAAARAQLEANPSRATDSIAGALRSLGNTPRPKHTTRAAKPAPAPTLSSLAWAVASLEERRRFLEAVGRKSLLEAFPPTWRTETGEQAEPALAGPTNRRLH